eukprot:TRINITY_DN1031_c0_g1_i4.p1 TRINITY_DN1031_c0_g1~~TRINITY_DN1031_c0_g1_i4.p1  ORF type:complete len:870 (-),score=207.47 TRINITY_DN1031_c0_g1_i4:1683-4292(-)
MEAQLAQWLWQTLSADAAERAAGERSLRDATTAPLSSTSAVVPPLIRIVYGGGDASVRGAAACFLKNALVASGGGAGAEDAASFVAATLLERGAPPGPPALHRQLLESLRWATSEAADPRGEASSRAVRLVAQLGTPHMKDSDSTVGVLLIVHALTKRFKTGRVPPRLFVEIEELLLLPLLQLFASTTLGNTPESFLYIKLLLKILNCVCTVQLPACIKLNMSGLNGLFQPCFGAFDPTLAHAVVQAQVQAYKFLNRVLQHSCPQVEPTALLLLRDLCTRFAQPQEEEVTYQAATFCDTALRQCATLVVDRDVATTLCSTFVPAAAHYRGAIDLEENYDEFIRQELEGCDVGTSRKALKNIMQLLVSKAEEAAVAALLTRASSLFQSPNWKDKEVALFLVSGALFSRRREGESAAAQALPSGFSLRAFVDSCVCPLVMDANGSHPQLRAAAIKFLYTFRLQEMQFPDECVLRVLQCLVAGLSDEAYPACQTFAALALYGVMTVAKGGAKCSRIGGEQFFGQLFAVLVKGLHSLQSSQRNDHFSKLLMRVLMCAPRELVCACAASLLPHLVAALSAIVRSPMVAAACSPAFCHCLFECTAALIRLPHISELVETLLFPVFHTILTTQRLQFPHMDVFSSYVAQLLAAYLETTTRPLTSETHLPLLPHFVDTKTWEEHPQLVFPFARVLRAFIRKTPKGLFSGELIEQVLTIAVLLSPSETTALEAFNLLFCLVQYCDTKSLFPCLAPLLAATASTLASSKNHQAGFIVLFSLLVTVHSSSLSLTTLQHIDPSFVEFAFSLLQERAPSLPLCVHRKICAVCTVGLAVDPLFCNPQAPYASLWYASTWKRMGECLVLSKIINFTPFVQDESG